MSDDNLKLQKRIIEFKKKHNFNREDLYLEFAKLVAEIGEAINALQKKEGPQRFAEELADVGLYVYAIAEIAEVDLFAEMLKKMDLNDQRTWPEGTR